jgi:hypothetical protein
VRNLPASTGVSGFTLGGNQRKWLDDVHCLREAHRALRE